MALLGSGGKVGCLCRRYAEENYQGIAMGAMGDFIRPEQGDKGGIRLAY